MPDSVLKRFAPSTLIGGLAGGVALVVYLLTMALDLTSSNFGGDGGELITAAVTLGISHPPGYPTYVLIGKLFSLLPIGSMALRFNLFSALAMATAVGFVSVTAYESLAGSRSARPAALATGLAFAFTPLVWSQAVITEVYALNCAFLSIYLWALIGRNSSALSGFMLGLSITTHLTSLLMLPMGVALTKRGRRGLLFFSVALGLLPLLALPLLARLGSPVVWGDPTTWSGWWWLVSGQLYRANLSLPPFANFLHPLSFFSRTILAQYALIGWLFIILGVPVNRLGSLRTIWLLATAAFYAIFTLFYTTNDATVLLLPALLVLSPLLAAGLARVGRWSLILPLALLILNFQSQNLRDEQPIRPWVEATLQQVPQNAILLTPGDQSIFLLWYFQHVEGQRTDLILVDANLLAFDWYRENISLRYPELQGLGQDDLAKFMTLNTINRPVCTISVETPDLELTTLSDHCTNQDRPIE
ncbi:MAG: DUF2723 domain-containing protein [Anaerolineaceae bacterium]|nr:MAG: DUF2723 domain-containing protein [Anaerolineaceae bacterium]